jgi:hypothetical protein
MESLRHRGPSLGGFIDDDGQEECQFIGDIPLAFYSELPLAPKIPFKPGLGMGRDDGNEKHTVTDLVADFAIPSVPAPEFALVKPDLDASGPESAANPQCRVHILRGVT